MKSSLSQTRPSVSARIQELPTVSATLLKNSIGEAFDKVAAMGAVAITRHEKPRAVLLSVEEYQARQKPQEYDLSALEAEYQEMLMQMQTPESKAGAERAFWASPEELGEAALAAANRERQESSRK